MEKWWFIQKEDVAGKLITDINHGLISDEATKRKSQYGPNQLDEKPGRSPIALFFDQFRDFIIWVLIAAALVSGFLQEWVDALAIICIVIINAILGFIQEYRAEKSLAALKKMSSPNSKVIRDGQQQIIPSEDIVPGDLIDLEAGDHIPADGRIVYATGNFSTLEASLTGESTPVDKITGRLEKEDTPLADHINMVYLGTSVVSGKGRAIITSTGMKT
jgi:P-type Ca2+ transporter type 2C